MKAVFIDKYQNIAEIESRVNAFFEWRNYGQPGDGTICPVSIIPDEASNKCLIIFDQNEQTTDPTDPVGVESAKIIASRFLDDIRDPDNIEVLDELYKGKVFYCDTEIDNEKEISAFLAAVKGDPIFGRDSIAIESLRGMITDPSVWDSFSDGIRQGYGLEDAGDPNSYDIPVVSETEAETALLEEEDTSVSEYEELVHSEETDEIPEEDPVPEVSDSKEIMEPQMITTVGKYDYILEGLDRYLNEHDMTIDAFLEQIHKYHILLKQATQIKAPVDVSELSPEEKEERENAERKEVQNENQEASLSVDDILREIHTNTVIDEETGIELEDPNPEAVKEEIDHFEHDVEEGEITPIEEDHDEAVATSHPDEIVPEEPQTEEDLLNNLLKNSNNDDEFFDQIVEHKEEISTETLQRAINTKLFDVMITGETIKNIMAVKFERAQRLGFR